MWIERAHQIDIFIASGDDSVIHSRETLLFMGERQVLPVYKIPVELLSFNVVNGRFAAEKRKFEEENGFELDATNPDHESYFINLLLPRGPKSDALVQDLKRNGQLRPGVMTHDGFLVDANRRTAAMKLLNMQGPGSRYQYLLVHRLPANVPPKEIYKLEVQFQIKDELKEKYNPINDLLKIKQGLDLMDELELAESLGWKPRDIQKYRRRLELVDGFLEFIEQPGNYTKVLDFNEHFVEFQKELDAMKKSGLSVLDLDEATDAFYYALRVNLDENFSKSITQRDHIRNMRQAFLDPKIREVLTKNMFHNPDATSADIFNDVSAAAELAKVQRSNEKPIELLRRAINLLAQIQEDHDTVSSDDFREGLEEIESLVQQFKGEPSLSGADPW